MKTILFFISIIIFTNNLHSQSLFETDFYEIDFISNNVEDDKIRKISN